MGVADLSCFAESAPLHRGGRPCDRTHWLRSWLGGRLQGLLAAIPLVAFAAVSPLVPSLTSRIGVDCTILLALIAIALGDVIRSFTGGVGIWVGTVVFASAIAVGNVLVPVIAKRDYADHVATATGIYSACITCGSAAAGLTASAMAQAWGGWRYALAFWAVPPLIVAVLWTARIVHSWRDAASDACNALRQMPMTASDRVGLLHARIAASPDDLVGHLVHGHSIFGVLHHVELDAERFRACGVRCHGGGRASVRLPVHRHFLRSADPQTHADPRQSDLRGCGFEPAHGRCGRRHAGVARRHARYGHSSVALGRVRRWWWRWL